MKRISILLLLPLALVFGQAAALAAPNVLFIAVDDLNDWTGAMGGHPQVRTPNFDRLAARGTLFERAYCAAPACNPSRVSVLTGIRPSTSGMYVNDQKFRKILPDAVTLPQYFTQQGYRVAGGGKIFHHGDIDPRSWPEYFKQPNDPQPNPKKPGPVGRNFTWQPLDVGDEAMGDYKVVSWASDWLKKHAEDTEPFFLAVGFYRPHMPLHVPRKYFEAHPLEEVELPVVKAGDIEDVPPMGKWLPQYRAYHQKIAEAGHWKKAVQGYLASIEFFDGQLGRLMEALDASPKAKDTIVVLWSDHGWHLGQKDHWSKFALWEQATRSELLVIAPGITEPGSRCTTPVSLLDIYPTLTELCEMPLPGWLEGDSLVPQLKDPTTPRSQPALTTHGPGSHALRDPEWRYIRYKDGTEELYNHEADPLEWDNLAGLPEYEEVKRRLSAFLPKSDKPLLTKSKWLPPAEVEQ